MKFEFEIFFDKNDFWIGLYYTKKLDRKAIKNYKHWYICLIPCIVFHYKKEYW